MEVIQGKKIQQSYNITTMTFELCNMGASL